MPITRAALIITFTACVLRYSFEYHVLRMSSERQPKSLYSSIVISIHVPGNLAVAYLSHLPVPISSSNLGHIKHMYYAE